MNTAPMSIRFSAIHGVGKLDAHTVSEGCGERAILGYRVGCAYMSQMGVARVGRCRGFGGGKQ
jgi:hypothetical protein